MFLNGRKLYYRLLYKVLWLNYIIMVLICIYVNKAIGAAGLCPMALLYGGVMVWDYRSLYIDS